MNEKGANEKRAIEERLRRQAKVGAVRVTMHAQQEMVDDNVTYDEIQEVLSNAQVVENYADHKRGPCCLICAQTSLSRYLHVVCTTSLDLAIIITVYEPKLPKWETPFVRGKKS